MLYVHRTRLPKTAELPSYLINMRKAAKTWHAKISPRRPARGRDTAWPEQGQYHTVLSCTVLSCTMVQSTVPYRPRQLRPAVAADQSEVMHQNKTSMFCQAAMINTIIFTTL